MLVGIGVDVLVNVRVGVRVDVLVDVPVGVRVGVYVDVRVGVRVGVRVSVPVGVRVSVFVGVCVGVWVGVDSTVVGFVNVKTRLVQISSRLLFLTVTHHWYVPPSVNASIS